MIDEQEQFFMDKVEKVQTTLIDAQAKLAEAQRHLNSYREVKGLYGKLDETLSRLYNSYDQDGDVLFERVKKKIGDLTAW